MHAPFDPPVNRLAESVAYWALLTAATALTGCGSEDPVVARVGAVEIRASQLARFVDGIPQGMRSREPGPGAVREHLESVVDQELLLHEAAARGIDEAVQVRREVASRARSRLSQSWVRQATESAMEVTPAEVEAAFRDRGYDRQRQLARVLVPTEEEAHEVVRRLQDGQDGGDRVGWVGVDDLDAVAIPEQVFFSLADGRLADPVDLGHSWQVYRFLQTREAKLEAVWESLHDLLLRERWHQRLRQEYESLARRFDLTVDERGLGKLLPAGGQRSLDSLVADEDPLYRFAGRVLTVGEFAATLRGYGIPAAWSDSGGLAVVAERRVLPEYLFAAAARELGWHRAPEFVAYLDGERREVVLRALAEDELQRHGGVSKEDARRFYDRHPERFTEPDHADIRRLYVHSRELASQLRRQLEEGVPMDSLLKLPDVAHHVHPGSGGRTRLFPIHRSRFPELVDAAFRVEVGELSGPLPMADGWVVFRLLERAPGKVQPYERVRGRARSLLRTERQTDRMTLLIRRLREERRPEMALYPERFAEWETP